jgi:ATP-binding cassette subfamily F protein 3
MVSRGGVAPFDGDLDDYQRYLLDEAKRQRELIKDAQAEAAKAKTVTKTSAKTSALKPTELSDAARKYKKEIQTIEARMEVLNAEGAALEVRLAAQPLSSEIADLGKRLKSVNDEIKDLEDQWLKLSSQLEV